MIDKFKGGPVGLDTLAAAIGEDAGTLEDVYEPYLLKSGFLVDLLSCFKIIIRNIKLHQYILRVKRLSSETVYLEANENAKKIVRLETELKELKK